VAVHNLPRWEVGRTGVYWLTLDPSARTSGGRLGTAKVLSLLVGAEDVLSHTLTFVSVWDKKGQYVLSHTLTFECVGQCSWKVLNCRRDVVVVQGTGGNRHLCHHYVRVRQLHQSWMFLSHISLLSAPSTTTSLAVPWCTMAWCSSRLPVTAVLSVYPAFSCTVLSLNPKLLVSQGSAPMVYFDLALLSHCGFFRASVCLACSLLEHSETHALERHCAGCPLCAGGPPVYFLSIRTLSRVCTHKKICSSPLCASDVQYSQEFCTPGQHVRDLNCCAAKSWLLCLISPTPCSFHHCTHQGRPANQVRISSPNVCQNEASFLKSHHKVKNNSSSISK